MSVGTYQIILSIPAVHQQSNEHLESINFDLGQLNTFPMLYVFHKLIKLFNEFCGH